LNPGAGGDACSAWQSVGFSPSPPHGSENQPPSIEPTLSIIYEFSPTTPLKEAVEAGVRVTRADSGAVVPASARWVVQREARALRYVLTPTEPLTPGAYFLTAPRDVWVEFAKPYSGRYSTLSPFRAAEFPLLPNGDLRAEFEVGASR
jgi:hypothetical protein